jgi:Flp pilus assembly secretin CpaC
MGLAERQMAIIRTTAEIERTEVIDADIAEVTKYAANELLLKAKGPGQTHVRLWLKGREQSTNYLVTVVSSAEASQRVEDQCSKLRQAVRDAYPHLEIELVSAGDRIIVSGSVNTHHEALAVLSLLRQERTVPIVDRLTVDR